MIGTVTAEQAFGIELADGQEDHGRWRDVAEQRTRVYRAMAIQCAAGAY
jgi:hypothetical protein